MKPPSRKRIIEWILDPWSQMSKVTIKPLKCCDLNLVNGSTEDDFIQCLKKVQSCKAGRQKLNSQLSILVDKSDAVNPFNSPSDEEDTNK